MKDLWTKILELYRHQYTRFAFAIIVFILWVIWVGNYWLLFIGPIIFDIYITRKVNWTFWKKRNAPNPWYIEWLDALIFAVFFVTLINIFLFQNYKIPTGSMEKTLLIGDHLYVSKVSFGPRIPNTPLSFPFTQHTMPMTTATPSYLEWIKWPYKRLKGFNEVKRNDLVVFNFPEGDTVVVEQQAQSYYSIVRDYAEYTKKQDIQASNKVKTDREYYNIARNKLWIEKDIIIRPMDRTDNYIKRCVAIAGDTLVIIEGQSYINGQKQEHFEDMQFRYWIRTDGTVLNDKLLDKLGIDNEGGDRGMYPNSFYCLPLTSEEIESVKNLPYVDTVFRKIEPKGSYDYRIFPHSPDFAWNEDNFGPLYIPKKGATVKLDQKNICLYERIIDMYEENDLRITDSIIYINGKPASEYTFRLNYFFMMGDNRHSSYDGRFWGFVPETHVIGRPKFIWLSLDKLKSFPANIRFKRMFKGV